MRIVVFVLALLSTSVMASEPGQPTDCGDWVILEPGISCGYWRSPGDPVCVEDPTRCDGDERFAFDNQGQEIILRTNFYWLYCPLGTFDARRYEVWVFNGVAERRIAYLEDKCGQPVTIDYFRVETTPLGFDPQTGRLTISGRTACGHAGINNCTYQPSAPFSFSLNGFTTLFEVLQTFVPDVGPGGFRVPVMPEGMGGADHFDTYYGNLTKPIDFAHAQPLACGYPAAPPAVGDYLEVADTLPDPAPGTGRYYVTAATYQGQTRYGRKTSGGRLSGRDPAVLPACSQP